MKKSAKPNPQPCPDDTDEMRDAIKALNGNGIRFFRLTRHQLKSGDISFYPSKGSIYRDCDDGALEERGLNAFIAELLVVKQPIRYTILVNPPLDDNAN